MKNEMTEPRQRPWLLTLIVGIVSVAVGGILLWAPAKTAAETWIILVTTLGFYWLLTGTLEVASLTQDRSQWGLKLLSGLIGIFVGGYVLVFPIEAAIVLPLTIVLVLGIWGVVHGIFLVYLATHGGGWGAGVWGALAIIFGILLIVNWTSPGMGLALIWTAAIFGFVGGILLIILSLRVRSMLKENL